MEVRWVLLPDAIPNVDDPPFGPDSFGDPDDEVLVVADEAGRFAPTARPGMARRARAMTVGR